jgi:LysR family transcriptional regulator, regulator for genes of the gallate degradation pathway
MWTDIPNLRHLRAFAAAVEHGGATRAAERIHLSQPAVTQALAKLEARLGAKLFVVGADGMRPTEIGRVFHDRVARAFALIETGAREALGAEARRGGDGVARFARLLTVAQLRALAAMQFNRNFSLAARELKLSQPSIHRAARDLERIMGATLFVAARQGVELTPAASIFARHAALAHAELKQGFAEVAERLDADPGEIVVGTMPFARTKLLPDALNALARERPRARMRVISAPYDGLLGRLRYGVIDFLVGALRDPPPIDDVVQEPLFDDPLSIVARRGHPLTQGASVSRADLLAYPWVAPAEETPARAVFDRLFPPDDIARMPGGLIETSSLVLLRGLLTGSDRLALMSARQARIELDQGLLALAPFRVPIGTRRIGLTTRRGWRPTPTQALLLELLRRSREAEAAPDAIGKTNGRRRRSTSPLRRPRG